MPRKFIDVYDLKEHTEEMKTLIGDGSSSGNYSYNSVQPLETTLTTSHPYTIKYVNSTPQEDTSGTGVWDLENKLGKENPIVTTTTDCPTIVDQLYATQVKLLRDAFRTAIGNGDIPLINENLSDFSVEEYEDVHKSTIKVLSYIPKNIAYEYSLLDSEGNKTGSFKFFYDVPDSLDWKKSGYWSSRYLDFISPSNGLPLWKTLFTPEDFISATVALGVANKGYYYNTSEEKYTSVEVITEDQLDSICLLSGGKVPVSSVTIQSNAVTAMSNYNVVNWILTGSVYSASLTQYYFTASGLSSEEVDISSIFPKIALNVSAYSTNGHYVLALNGTASGLGSANMSSIIDYI